MYASTGTDIMANMANQYANIQAEAQFFGIFLIHSYHYQYT